MRTSLVATALALATTIACAQSVALSGRMGDKALLVINGTPKTVAPGTTVQGVKLLSMGASDAVVEIDGKRMTLPLGGSPVSVGMGNSGQGHGSQIVLTAGSGGHFLASGSINGKPIQFLVDTGATLVAISQSDADRMGLNYKDGRRGMVNTANGAVVAYRTTLGVVRVGDVSVYDVDAVVIPAAMSYALLGNSFLTRFQMRRENDRMTLERRY